MGAITRVGRFTVEMTLAMVKVLPLPVMPRRTWWSSPRSSPSASSVIALGWSPFGVIWLTSSMGRFMGVKLAGG